MTGLRWSTCPVGFTKLSGPRYNWGFSTVPQPQLNNREMWYPQGRTLGGSTSINAMIYIRGQREDYEAWAELGNKDWGYDQVLPFFRRAEANERLNDRYHSSGGAVNVTEQVQHNPLSKAFVRAAQELGVDVHRRLQRRRRRRASAGTTSPRRTPAGRAPRPLISSRPAAGRTSPSRPRRWPARSSSRTAAAIGLDMTIEGQAGQTCGWTGS